jgi:phosphate transport system ATP-binding protein
VTPSRSQRPGQVLTVKADVRSLSFYYGDFRSLKDISLSVHSNRVTALIGPSGCGKSTFLRCFNRIHDLYPGNRYEGSIHLHPDNVNILSKDVDPIDVRMRIGMVFQKPSPFPDDDLRERGLWPAPARPGAARGGRRQGRGMLARGGAVG